MRLAEIVETKSPFPIPATPANIERARAFVLRKWQQRVSEMGRPVPDDLSGSCKASSMFAQRVFGGKIMGNYHHQFVELDNGDILDLNADAADVAKVRSDFVARQAGKTFSGERHTLPRDPHSHDRTWFGNPDHKDSMKSLEPRVAQWVKEFADGLPVAESTNRPDYPDILSDAHAIADYIAGHASDDVDDEFIAEYFRGCHATLRLIPASEISEGDKDHNIRSKAKERRYAKMDPATMPPLVVENGKIMDGGHRFRVGLAKGKNAFWCYNVTEISAVAESTDAYTPPTIEVGDDVLVGKFKNRKAEVTGFTKDDHNQPVLKTTKGDQKLFKPRIVKIDKDKP